MRPTLTILTLAIGLASAAETTRAFGGSDPFAVAVVDYAPGSNASPAYLDPTAALGSPERFTGEGIFPSVVSPFSPPYNVGEIVSIGAGGHLIVQFDSPVVDDPNNLYGIDLLIFNNAGFIDTNYPSGIVGGVFGNDGGIIEVSPDGKNWVVVPQTAATGLWPTLGYLDAGPYDPKPGSEPTDFTRPVDPSLTMDDMMGLNHEQVIQKYRGSGGGVGIDLAGTGLAQITYVRISNPAGATASIEIDAFAKVTPRLPGDVNLDGVVNVDDLLLLISVWGPHIPGGMPADFDNNGVINVDDLLIVISNWGS